MIERSPEEWRNILIQMGVKQIHANQWSIHFSTLLTDSTFSKGLKELPDFLSQILHESAMLSTLEENLGYSCEGMRRTWPKRFPDKNSTLPCEFKPRALANKVYGGRLGNDLPDDGWNYRGSGLIMVTGKCNYMELEKALNIPIVSDPSLLRIVGGTALKIAIHWWENKVPDSAIGDPLKVRKAVNGGTIGLTHTVELVKKLRSLLEQKS